MNDRLDAVEKKIADLEQSVPREVDEWRKLHKVIINFKHTTCIGNQYQMINDTPAFAQSGDKNIFITLILQDE